MKKLFIAITLRINSGLQSAIKTPEKRYLMLLWCPIPTLLGRYTLPLPFHID